MLNRSTMTPSQSGIVLLSGGLDSSAALALSLKAGWTISFGLTFDYGQRAAREEIAHSRKIAEYFNVPHQTLKLPWFHNFKKGGALLSNKVAIPRPSIKELRNIAFAQDFAAQVWVPNRNGIFIEIAAALAEDSGLDAIIVGFNREEAKTFPDNSLEYLEAVSRSLYYSTSNHVKVVSHTASLIKDQIVERTKRGDFPFHLLWSCYEAGTVMCGLCESCLRLKSALKRNGVSIDGFFECTDEP